jgi:N-acetylglutamate synthase-like GNAT family acetyltransferase
MFITRATRHDHDDIRELLEAHDWDDHDVTQGVVLIARDGKVAGTVQIIEVAPQTVVVAMLLVRADKRGAGLGRQLMGAAMNNRGGKLYLSCHDNLIPYYEKFGFSVVEPETLPEPVLEFFTAEGDYPSTPDHVHYFMTAR